jgi:hypothetical protein
LGLLSKPFEEELVVKKYVRTLHPGHKINPVHKNNGIVYEVIAFEGGSRFFRHGDIAQIKGGSYVPVAVETAPINKKPIQKTRNKKKQQQKIHKVKRKT